MLGQTAANYVGLRPRCDLISLNVSGSRFGITLDPQLMGGSAEGSVLKSADTCAAGDLRLIVGPVFDASKIGAILAKRIVDSIVIVISHVLAKKS